MFYHDSCTDITSKYLYCEALNMGRNFRPVQESLGPESMQDSVRYSIPKQVAVTFAQVFVCSGNLGFNISGTGCGCLSCVQFY